jgi:hypothetical protein
VSTALVAAILVPPARSSLAVAVLGYGLGALVTPVLAVLHRFKKQAALKSVYYVGRVRYEHLALIALCVGVLAGLCHAWLAATELAKQ